MSKKIVSIAFSVFFLLFIAAPTVVTIVDDTIDTSIFYSVTEEENKSFELTINETSYENEAFFVSMQKQHLEYYFKKYPKPHLNLISPPPEHNIL
ncbi:hypothetical protein [Lacinutrix chionoecetis]